MATKAEQKTLDDLKAKYEDLRATHDDLIKNFKVCDSKRKEAVAEGNTYMATVGSLRVQLAGVQESLTGAQADAARYQAESTDHALAADDLGNQLTECEVKLAAAEAKAQPEGEGWKRGMAGIAVALPQWSIRLGRIANERRGSQALARNLRQDVEKVSDAVKVMFVSEAQADEAKPVVAGFETLAPPGKSN